MTRFVVVPQWQGSPSPRAMQLVDGAEAIAGDLPRTATTVLDAPLEAGGALGTPVARLSALLQHRERLDAELARRTGAADDSVVVIGGDCGVAVGAVAHAATRTERLALVWADAHPDLHTPETSPSHAFSGMALRAILGEGIEGLALAEGTVAPGDVILVGPRTIDPAEADWIADHDVRVISVEALADPDALAAAVQATGASGVYVHIDVDVLDPEEMPGVKTAEPFGASTGDLIAAVKHLRAQTPIVGASLTEFLPASPESASEDLGTLLRLVGALA